MLLCACDNLPISPHKVVFRIKLLGYVNLNDKFYHYSKNRLVPAFAILLFSFTVKKLLRGRSLFIGGGAGVLRFRPCTEILSPP